jgi:activator of HSP90 ATPase
MTKAIEQSVEFDVSPKILYEMYMSSRTHTKATGQPAKIGRRVGAPFTAFGGKIKGKNLLVSPGKMVVQAWRSTSWRKSDADSVLILTFSKTKDGGRVDLVHVNVPEHDHKGVTDGWEAYYWEPWRAYVSKLPTRRRKHPFILI